MAVEWFKTPFPGVRFYKHKTRKHGVKFDQYYAIRYQKDGKRQEEGLGWATEGWSAERASEELARLKRAARIGEGPQRLRESREIEEVRRLEETRQQEADRLAAITVAEFFASAYFPHAKAHKKPDSWGSEERLFRLWIAPVIGNFSFPKIVPFHLDKIKANMRSGHRKNTAPKKSKPRPLTPASINHALAVIRQIWNFARREGIVAGDWPGRDVKKLKVNNERTRFLARAEADRLLIELKSTSSQLHDIALISLHCGPRVGEIFVLTWDCIDFERETLLLIDTKNGKTRTAFMSPAVKIMLQRRKSEAEDGGLIFRDRLGKQIAEVSAAFARVVDRLGLNEGIEDPRRHVCFHTLRHTYASWLVEAGVDLYTVKELLGHKTLAMTARYSHLGENSLRQATRTLAATLDTVTPTIALKQR